MKTKELKIIQFCFENVEVVELKPEYIQNFLFDKITTILVNDWYTNNVHLFKKAKHAKIEINQAGNIELEDSGNAYTLFERIEKYNDLVSVVLVFKDDTSEEISFKWNKENGYTNKYQTTYKLPDGHLIVCISKKHKAIEYANSL